MKREVTYPDRAGSRGGGASALAADKITDSGRRASLERRVIDLFFTRADWTPDEAAHALNLHPADVRPRFSELCVPKVSRSGGVVIRPAMIRKTAEMRLSDRGNSQHVYVRSGSLTASSR